MIRACLVLSLLCTVVPHGKGASSSGASRVCTEWFINPLENYNRNRPLENLICFCFNPNIRRLLSSVKIAVFNVFLTALSNTQIPLLVLTSYWPESRAQPNIVKGKLYNPLTSDQDLYDLGKWLFFSDDSPPCLPFNHRVCSYTNRLSEKLIRLFCAEFRAPFKPTAFTLSKWKPN